MQFSVILYFLSNFNIFQVFHSLSPCFSSQKTFKKYRFIYSFLNFKNSILVLYRVTTFHGFSSRFQMILDVFSFKVLEPSDIVSDDVMVVTAGARDNDNSLLV